MTRLPMTPGELDGLLRQRLRPIDHTWQQTSMHRAAVLAPIVTHGGADALLFVVRSASLRQHPGQIGFPGGVDAGDGDPVACALRETHEEIGVDPDQVALLGSVSPRPSSSGYRVHCLVGRIDSAANLRLDGSEVERTLLVPLADLLQSQRWREHRPAAAPGHRPYPPSPHFAHRGDVIWGLTGRFTADLVAAVRGPIDPPVDQPVDQPGDQPGDLPPRPGSPDP